MSVAVPPLGGQDFADRSKGEQNILRAMAAKLRAPEPLSSLAILTPDATDEPSAVALVNELKAAFNQLAAEMVIK